MQLFNLKLLRLTVKELHLHENTVFNLSLDLGVKVTKNVAQNSLLHVTYAAAIV